MIMEALIINLTMSDDRDYIDADAKSGIYYINKKRTVKTFSFGEGELHSDCEQANKSLSSYLAKRVDSDSLNVTLINF
jgi:hypothetical protein